MENTAREGSVLVRLEQLCKSYDGEQILKSVDLTIKDKQFVTLLGPSGCGKTTILRCIAGFETPNSGTVFFEGKPMNDVPPHLRPVNTVFQKYALFPHLNVFDNVAFGLRIRKVPEKEIRKKVLNMLAMVDLKGYEKRPVSKLSGGQQQRVAIARALVNMPRLLLLDEPLGALDLKLRKDMQLELRNIHKQADTTFLYVTHDQEEALTMSDMIVVMKSGTIQQIGSPQDVYNEPANAFVADFIGEANIFDAAMPRDERVVFSGAEFVCVDKKPAQLVDVVVRPEDVEVVSPFDGTVAGEVLASLFKGVHYEMTVQVGEDQWIIHSTRTCKVGEVVGLRVAPENIHVMKKMFPTSENEVDAVITGKTDETGKNIVSFDGEEFPVSAPGEGGQTVTLTLSPDDIELCAEDEGVFSGVLDSVVWKSNHYEMILVAQNRRWLIRSQVDEQAGAVVGIRFDPAKLRVPQAGGEEQ